MGQEAQLEIGLNILSHNQDKTLSFRSPLRTMGLGSWLQLGKDSIFS